LVNCLHLFLPPFNFELVIQAAFNKSNSYNYLIYGIFITYPKEVKGTSLYLAKLRVNNFRKLKDTTFEFTDGLNVILGPNNIGKTALVDALRCLLTTHEEPYSRVTIDDLHRSSDPMISTDKIVFKYIFSGLSMEDEADFIQSLVLNCDGTYDAHITITYTPIEGTDRMRLKRWAGAREDLPFSHDMLENLRGVYLPPLRDASQGLRPGRSSQLGRLMRLFGDRDPAGKDLVNESLAEFDKELKKTGPIKKTSEAILSRHGSMMGEKLSQLLELGVSGSDFKRLSSRLSIIADRFEVELNGLGFNNLIYMAVVLSEMVNDGVPIYRGLIVEEPESHLHPQLQVVLQQYLQEIIEDEGKVQIFVTSHSPNFASSTNLSSITCISEFENKVSSFTPRDITFPGNATAARKLKNKLQRFINVTRAELFFAQKVIFVEGSAELLLVGEMANKLGKDYDLKKNAVSLISVDGLNFDCFIPLFGKSNLTIPVSIITDADPESLVEPDTENKVAQYPDIEDIVVPSNNTTKLDGNKSDLIKIYWGQKTLEYDLALFAGNRELMLNALYEIHPEISDTIRSDVASAKNNVDKAKALYCGMFVARKIQKGPFAQELAYLISESTSFKVPNYIVDAISHVCGIKKDD
jgi:putative ATP-dependent endonuclease of OLD family